MQISVRGLVESSRSAKAEDLKERISNVKQILRQERRSHTFGFAEVTEGLVKFPKQGSITIVGDLHGDLESLSTILHESKILEEVQEGGESFLAFLGDYGDRGEYSPEVYHVILTLKTNFPDNVLMMRGNHEGPLDLGFYPYDLPDQLITKFGRSGEEIHGMIRELWDEFYYVAIVENSYLILHGGVPTEADNLQDVARARDLHPQKPHLIEILWNDPRDGLRGTLPSSRGIGKLFGSDITSKTLELTGTKTLIRGHEVCLGVRVNHSGKVLTVFSSRAPYRLPEAAFLKIALTQEVMNAHTLAERASRF